MLDAYEWDDDESIIFFLFKSSHAALYIMIIF